MIGRGGFGITYLAFDIKAEKILAIKEYFPANIAVRERKGLVIQPISEKKSGVYNEGLKHFSAESGLISQFNGNPNIVNVFECFSENNTAYCVMEHLRGTTLEKYIEKHGALNVEQGVYLAEKLGLALVAIHSAGLLHRDIAPDNIMLCEDGRVKLLDFGAAREVREETSLTVMMKTGFTPVEQYSGGASLTPRSDIYALGMVLFYALTEKQPKSVFMRMEDDGEFTDSLWAIPESFRNVIKKAAAINSAERFDSAADFLNALSDMKIRGEAITLSREEFSKEDPLNIYHRASPAKPNHFLIGICTGVLLCAAVLTPVLIFRRPRPEGVEAQSEIAPVTIEFGSFDKNMSSQYVGRISRNTLDEFGGNVKITLEVETLPDFINAPEIYLIYPVDSSGANMIDYCAPVSDSSEADITGAVPIEKDAQQFSFVLTRSGIEALNGGFGFETYHVAISSVCLEATDEAPEGFSFTDISLPDNGAAEYSVSSQDGSTKVLAVLKEYYVTDWGGRMTNYIPKAAFDGFEGDIKLTFQFEYSPKSSEPDQEYQILYLQTLGYFENHVFEFAEVVQIYDEEGSPLIRRTDNLGINPALSCTECSVILPKNIVDKICGGLGFTGDNMIITGVAIEGA
ncbi:MAG: serine/threonine protein kinase [Firmicutes bacterium]|nr:serine/threonine protein kinase [Bacillota bacterium]